MKKKDFHKSKNFRTLPNLSKFLSIKLVYHITIMVKQELETIEYGYTFVSPNSASLLSYINYIPLLNIEYLCLSRAIFMTNWINKSDLF